MSLKIPQDYTEFLYWIKERTESFWSKNPETSEDDFVCEEWAYEAKWVGLTEQEIDEIEIKYGIKFTKFHREFLKILHTIDRKRKYEGWDEEGNSFIRETPFFYNWLEDEIEINNYLNWPKEFLLDDVLSDHIWLKSWGEKPNSKEEKESIFKNWIKKAPKLVPISGHRFVISEPNNTDNPVLSIWGEDTIIYGGNMRHYLINELREELDLMQLEYEEEGSDEYSIEHSKELDEINEYEFNLIKNKEIPMWGEFLMSNGYNNYLIKNKDNNM